MPEPDIAPQADHEDAAGWALGILDPDDAGRFEAHLPACEQCQQAVSEFGPAALLLTAPVPDLPSGPGVEPAASLQARTLTRVEQAASRSG
jgi:anti-sigma factor RsiW